MRNRLFPTTTTTTKTYTNEKRKRTKEKDWTTPSTVEKTRTNEIRFHVKTITNMRKRYRKEEQRNLYLCLT
jgi:hypothetical protein